MVKIVKVGGQDFDSVLDVWTLRIVNGSPVGWVNRATNWTAWIVKSSGRRGLQQVLRSPVHHHPLAWRDVHLRQDTKRILTPITLRNTLYKSEVHGTSFAQDCQHLLQ